MWNTVLVTAGAAAGASWGKILDVLNTYSNITVIVVGIAALIGSTVYFSRRKERSISLKQCYDVGVKT